MMKFEKLSTGGIFDPQSHNPTTNIWTPPPFGMQSGRVVASYVPTNYAAVFVSAFNACLAINPTNPLAVAEAIGEMVDMIERLIGVIGEDDYTYADELLRRIRKVKP